MAARKSCACSGFLSGRKWQVLILGMAFGLLTGGIPAKGQPAEQVQRERILEEPWRLQMDQQVPAAKRVLLDYGGWFRSGYWTLDEDVVRDPDQPDSGYHAYRSQQLRLWGNLNIDQAHEFYARMKLDYFDWNHGTSFNHNDSDWVGPNLERGWYDFSLSRALKAYGQPAEDYDFAVRVGRQYVELGTGLALSVPLDAVVASVTVGDWKVTGLGAKSISSTYDIDRTAPDPKEDRCYGGAQLNYSGWRDHEPFVYYFRQNDRNGGQVDDGQTFGYDSQYVGAGSRGQFFHRDLEYTIEGVGEFGRSYADSPYIPEEENIKAWAFDTELRYLIPEPHRSQLSVEYLLTSGDPDRLFSPTNTLGGNQAGTDDWSFSAWGFRNTGLVLAPRLSNLGMVGMGASTFPFNQHPQFQELKVGTNFYVYHKQQDQAAISDGLSLQEDRYVGSELDLFVNWRITSDIALTVLYGIFGPGDAFADQSDRQLFFTGLTLNF